MKIGNHRMILAAAIGVVVALIVALLVVRTYPNHSFWASTSDDDAAEVQALLDSTVKVNLNHQVRATYISDTGDDLGEVVLGEEIVDIGGSGTGVITDVADKGHGTETLVLTASHVCHTFDTKTMTVETWMGPIRIEIETISIDLTVENIQGVKEKAVVLHDDEKNDVCAMISEGNLGAVAELADELPPVGAKILHTGAPVGVWGPGYAGVVDGRYGGVADLGDLEEGWHLNMGLSAAGGSSGGPVWYQGKVVGLLVMGHYPTGNITWAVELGHLQSAMIEANLAWPRTSI